MSNNSFHDMMHGFDITYLYNNKFREYVDANYTSTIDCVYGDKIFKIEDIKSARKFWMKNTRRHPNYPWFNDSIEADAWIEAMPIGGYVY